MKTIITVQSRQTIAFNVSLKSSYRVEGGWHATRRFRFQPRIFFPNELIRQTELTCFTAVRELWWPNCDVYFSLYNYTYWTGWHGHSQWRRRWSRDDDEREKSICNISYSNQNFKIFFGLTTILASATRPPALTHQLNTAPHAQMGRREELHTESSKHSRLIVRWQNDFFRFHLITHFTIVRRLFTEGTFEI